MTILEESTARNFNLVAHANVTPRQQFITDAIRLGYKRYYCTAVVLVYAGICISLTEAWSQVLLLLHVGPLHQSHVSVYVEQGVICLPYGQWSGWVEYWLMDRRLKAKARYATSTPPCLKDRGRITVHLLLTAFFSSVSSGCGSFLASRLVALIRDRRFDIVVCVFSCRGDITPGVTFMFFLDKITNQMAEFHGLGKSKTL